MYFSEDSELAKDSLDCENTNKSRINSQKVKVLK